MKCYIDPRCKINYASYYILGLEKVLGKKNVIFSIKPFEDQFLSNLKTQWHGMAIILNDKDSKKIYIDYHDNSDIISEMYDWCDIYAKVNIKESDLKFEKILAIGPSFSIDIFSWFELIVLSINNWIQCRKKLELPTKQYFLDYLYTKIRRTKYKNYLSAERNSPDDNYIFGISTLWFSSYVTETNLYRKKFYEAAKKYFNFEGGFLIIKTEDEKYKAEIISYKHIATANRIGVHDYIKKTKKSLLVFNTPSVDNCHGWKIAEYLAMGKAIITTPFQNVFPTKELSFLIKINNIDEVDQLLYDIKIGKIDIKEKGAEGRKYFETYLSPEKVINRILMKF